MNINLKTIRGFGVYNRGTSLPRGTVRSVFLCPATGRIEGILFDTISLIPLSFLIDTKDIHRLIGHNLFLKDDCRIKPVAREPFPLPESFKCVVGSGRHALRLCDLNFDIKSGEITHIVTAEKLPLKKNKLSINKISITDNTIYIH